MNILNSKIYLYVNSQSLDQNLLYNLIRPTSLHNYNSQLFKKITFGQLNSTWPIFFYEAHIFQTLVPSSFSPLLPTHLSAQQIPFVCLQGKILWYSDSEAVWIYNSYNINLELLTLLFIGGTNDVLNFHLHEWQMHLIEMMLYRLGETKGKIHTIDGWQILQTLQNTEKLHLDCSHNYKSK